MQPNNINPKAFSNSEAITGVMGQQIPGTFDRQLNAPPVNIDPTTMCDSRSIMQKSKQ